MTLLADMATDIAGFYAADVGFAESCTGPSGSFYGVFGNEYIETDAGGSVMVSSAEPVLRTADINAHAVGDAITIRAVVYTVVEVMPDGNGETMHRLQL